MASIQISTNLGPLTKYLSKNLPKVVRGVVIESTNMALAKTRIFSINEVKHIYPQASTSNIGRLITVSRVKTPRGQNRINARDLGSIIYSLNTFDFKRGGGRTSINASIGRGGFASRNVVKVNISGSIISIGRTNRQSAPFSRARLDGGRYFTTKARDGKYTGNLRKLTVLGPALLFAPAKVRRLTKVRNYMFMEFNKAFQIEDAKASQRLRAQEPKTRRLR